MLLFLGSCCVFLFHFPILQIFAHMQSRPKNKTAAERDPTRVKENDEAKSNEKNKTQQRKKNLR